jgi:O-antigen/teichoic acid export membrane protein
MSGAGGGPAGARAPGARRYAGSVFWMGMAEAAARAGNVFLQLLLVRALAPARYGVFAYAYSLFLVVIALTSLGITEAFVREGARARDRIGSVLSGFFALRALSGGVAAAIIAVVAATSGADGPVILAVGLFLLFRSMTAFLATTFRAREVIWKEFVVRLAEVLALVAVASVALALRWSLPTVVWSLAAAGAACLAAAIAAFRALMPGFSWSVPPGALRRIAAAAPYGLPAVAGGWLLRIDIAFFQQLGRDPEKTAFFAAAVTLVLAAGLVPAIASAALYPSLARGGERADALVGRMLLLFGLAGAGLAAVLRAAPVFLVRAAYGPRYLPSAPWVSALAPFLLFLCPAIFAATVLAARGRAALLCVLLLVPLAVQAIADFFLFPSRAAAVVLVSIGLQAAVLVAGVIFLWLSRSRSYRS